MRLDSHLHISFKSLLKQLSYRQSRQLLRALQLSALLGALLFFLLALQLTSGSFQLAGTDLARSLVEVTTNPFTSLFLGLLATAVVQSSSTTTSLIVAIVAAGDLSLSQAIPMVMGANIGTALTSTIVSLGHIGNREEFQYAVAGAALHDFFNIFTVFLLFIVEFFTGSLSQLSLFLANEVGLMEGNGLGSLLFFIHDLAQWLLGFLQNVPLLAPMLGLLALFLSLSLLTQVMRWLIIGRVQRNLNATLFGRPWRSLLSGFGLTAAFQSSSVTTSLLVPLVATRKVDLRQAFPFVMGANMGTTTTALIAALITTGTGRTAALSAAFVHVLFNLGGTLFFYPLARIRNFPVWLADQVGRLSFRSRLYGVTYVILIFFFLPFLLIFITEGLGWLKE